MAATELEKKLRIAARLVKNMQPMSEQERIAYMVKLISLIDEIGQITLAFAVEMTPTEEEKLQADIATAEKNLNVLVNTSENYPGELDQPIANLVNGLASARARLAEIRKEERNETK